MASITSFPQDLKVSSLLANIKAEIVARVQQIPDYQELKHDISVVLFVCNSVENYCLKKKYAVDKKQLVVDILTGLFSLSDKEAEIVSKHIQFLYNGKLIQRLKTSVSLFRSLKSYVLKKL